MIKRYGYLIETVLLLSGILGVSYLQNAPGYVGYDLHPFYFVVLLMVLRYGYARGLPAMFLSSGLYAGFYVVQTARLELKDWLNPGVVVEKISTSGLHIRDLWGPCYQPLAFLALGMFIGWLVERDKDKIKYLSEVIARHQDEIADKNAKIQTISAINENISDQLTKTDQTFNILFKQTRSLFHEDAMSVYNVAYNLLLTTTKATKGYVFYLDGNRFTLAFPENADQDAAEFLASNATLIKTIRETQHCLRCDLLSEYEYPEATPVFVGPIMHQPTRSIYGLLVVQELDFTRYNDNTYLTFRNLCTWIGEALYARAASYSISPPRVKTGRAFPYLVKPEEGETRIRELVAECFDEN
jgi:hypothetical protein